MLQEDGSGKVGADDLRKSAAPGAQFRAGAEGRRPRYPQRFASLRRASRFLDWRAQRALVNDLEGLLGMIETKIIPNDVCGLGP